MDRRGFTVDPNREVFAEPKWFESLGATQKPSPYATAAWQYFHKTLDTFVTLDPEPVDPEAFDGGDNFLQNTYQTVWDAAVNFSDPDTTLLWDNGLYGDDLQGLVDDNPVMNVVSKTTIAVVKVYDELASTPGSVLETHSLLIDALDDASLTLEPIDPNDFTIFDNGDVILDPVPNPSAIYDGGTFSQQGLGEELDEKLFVFSTNPLLFRVNEIQGDPDDGVPFLIDSIETPEDDGLELEIGTFVYDPEPRGNILGEVHYELTGSVITITDWQHYNWHNSLPVEKAVKVIINDSPNCVEFVTVKNAPTAFWKKLGFKQVSKGGDTLVYSKNSKYVTTY